MSIIGKVDSLWRYPVKSMRGEALEEAFVGYAGFYGDRLYAFKSAASDKRFPYLTGREQARMLLYRPVFKNADLAAKPMNLAEAEQETPSLNACFDDPDHLSLDVETPDGKVLAVGDPALAASLGQGLEPGHDLSLLRSDRALTDCRPISLISRQTIDHLGEEIGASVDQRRFRANIYLDLGTGAAFGEDVLVGRTLTIGQTVQMTVVARDPRCKMITLDPDSGEMDLRVLQTLGRGRGGKAGVYAAVLREGLINQGDFIEVMD